MANEFIRNQILNVAESAVRKRGYNKLTFLELAGEVGVSSDTLQEHFATKEDLGLVLIQIFTAKVLGALEEIEKSNQNSASKLREYSRVYEGSLQENKMCLCGMMAAEHETLSDDMQRAITAFFDSHEIWVDKILISGLEAGDIKYKGTSLEHAQLIVSSLQGALLVAKSTGCVDRMKATASNIVGSYCADDQIS